MRSPKIVVEFPRGYGACVHPSFPPRKNQLSSERTDGRTESLDLATPDAVFMRSPPAGGGRGGSSPLGFGNRICSPPGIPPWREAPGPSRGGGGVSSPPGSEIRICSPLGYPPGSEGIINTVARDVCLWVYGSRFNGHPTRS